MVSPSSDANTGSAMLSASTAARSAAVRRRSRWLLVFILHLLLFIVVQFLRDVAEMTVSWTSPSTMAFIVPATEPWISPCTMPLTRIRPLPLLRATSFGTAKEVRSTMRVPMRQDLRQDEEGRG